jgi:hypothetical protein
MYLAMVASYGRLIAPLRRRRTKLPDLRQTLFHKLLDGEWLLALLRPMHSPIMVWGRFEFAYWAGQVSRLAL